MAAVVQSSGEGGGGPLPVRSGTFADGSADFMQVHACAGAVVTLVNPYADIWHDSGFTAVS